MADQKYPAQGPPPTGPPPPYVDPNAHPEGAGNVTVEKKPEPKQEKKGGFFSNLKKEAEKVGKEIGKGLDAAGNKINEAVDKNYTSALLDLFKNGNVVQLISRVTGRTVQLVMSAQGQLVVDANGPLDPNAFNTLFTVTNEGSNQVRLHNYDNYLAIHEGQVVIKNCPPGTPFTPETKFQLSQLHQQFVTLESLKEKGHHVGFMPNGELKPALATTKEPNSQLGVKLVSTPYPPVAVVTTTTTTTKK